MPIKPSGKRRLGLEVGALKLATRIAEW